MAIDISDLKRLIADGNEVTFADGSSTRIRFNARIMASIEDQYGSLDAFMAELQAATGSKFYHHINYVFQIVMRLPEDKVWDLIDTKRVMEYFKAIGAALLEAMPEPDAAEGNGVATPGLSPGVASTTSPSPSGTSTRRSSGR
jgi:hypothetical protein